MLKVLDLFSGIGGFSLGLERTGGFETVAFCEYEDFPRRVLAKHWPDVPCFPDVRELKGSDIDGPVDVICGGYPCQPFSTAGQRRGQKDDRHLWPEFNRLVDELRPSWVIGENVAGHISMGLDDVLSDLEGQGYACRTFVIPACAVNAPHRRDRVWTVGYSISKQIGSPQSRKLRMAPNKFLQSEWVKGPNCTDGSSENVAGADNQGPQRRAQTENIGSQRTRRNQQPQRCTDLPRAAWRTEPDVGRVAHGVPRRVDRLKALGNAVVPQIPEMIGYAILEAEKENQ
jgi:DNA (cytosine-5)-methyltransferase 1